MAQPPLPPQLLFPCSLPQALLHSLVHIENWAVDLAWDIIARFGQDPSYRLPHAFYDDFVTVSPPPPPLPFVWRLLPETCPTHPAHLRVCICTLLPCCHALRSPKLPSHSQPLFLPLPCRWPRTSAATSCCWRSDCRRRTATTEPWLHMMGCGSRPWRRVRACACFAWKLWLLLQLAWLCLCLWLETAAAAAAAAAHCCSWRGADWELWLQLLLSMGEGRGRLLGSPDRTFGGMQSSFWLGWLAGFWSCTHVQAHATQGPRCKCVCALCRWQPGGQAGCRALYP